MILLVWPVAIGLLLWGYLKRPRKEEAQFWGLFFTLAITITCLVIPLSAGACTAEYIAFYESNYENFGVVVEKTASYLSAENFEAHLVAGSIEKLEQAGHVSERLKEWRDEVNSYNLKIARYRFFSNHIFLHPLYPKLPNYIQPLIIGP